MAGERDYRRERKRYLDRTGRRGSRTPGFAGDASLARRAPLIRNLIYAAVAVGFAVVAVGIAVSVWDRMHPEPEWVAAPKTDEGPFKVEVSGAVESPGEYDVEPNTLVYELLAEARVRTSADLTLIDVNTRVTGPARIHVPFVEASPDSGPFMGIGLTAAEHERGKVEDRQLAEELRRAQESALGNAPPPALDLDHVNILYLGVPNVFFLAEIQSKRRSMHLMNLPLDTRVAFPNRRGADRLRDAYLLGGAPLLINQVEYATEIPVHAYLIQERLSFEKMVDLLGGIPLDVSPVLAEALDIPEGRQVLNGWEAYQFILFFRETISAADYVASQMERIHRWVEFAHSFHAQTRELSWLKMVRLVRHVVFETETNLKLSDALGLAKAVRGSEQWNIALDVLPGQWVEYKGVQYWETRPDDLTSRVLFEGMGEEALIHGMTPPALGAE
ncbi:MAG: hypothetical protein CME06_03040 [Gemmatimonadetes bacterium]|nr:hypothetical protein [Gemmatimonadota bacterium]